MYGGFDNPRCSRSSSGRSANRRARDWSAQADGQPFPETFIDTTVVSMLV